MDFFEFDGNVAGVAIQHGAISVLDLSGVVEDDDLGQEVFNFSSGVVLGVRANVSSSNIFDGDVLNVESDVVSGNGLFQSLVVHFYGFDISRDVNWGESDVHVGFKNTGFNSSDWDGTDTTDFVDIL